MYAVSNDNIDFHVKHIAQIKNSIKRMLDTDLR